MRDNLFGSFYDFTANALTAASQQFPMRPQTPVFKVTDNTTLEICQLPLRLSVFDSQRGVS